MKNTVRTFKELGVRESEEVEKLRNCAVFLTVLFRGLFSRSWRREKRTGWRSWSWAAPFYLRPIGTNCYSTSWVSPCCERDSVSAQLRLPSRPSTTPQLPPAPSNKGLLLVTSEQSQVLLCGKLYQEVPSRSSRRPGRDSKPQSSPFFCFQSHEKHTFPSFWKRYLSEPSSLWELFQAKSQRF